MMGDEAMWFESGHWIGFTDQMEEGRFFWLDGSDAEYTNWNGDGGFWQEPNNSGGNENCTEITAEGGWNDNYCDFPKKFICRRYDQIA